MNSQFQHLLTLVCLKNGAYPKSWESFNDIFIYIPIDKKPPKTRYDYLKEPAILGRSVSLFNEEIYKLISKAHWTVLEDVLGPRLLRFYLKECIFVKRSETGLIMISDLVKMTKILNADVKKKMKLDQFNVPMKLPKATPSSLSCALESNSHSLSDMKNVLETNVLQISTDHLLYKVASGPTEFSTRITLCNSSPEVLATSILVPSETIDGKNDVGEKLIASLGKTMKKLQKLHSNFKYERELDALIISESSKSDRRDAKYLKHKDQLSIHLLTIYFRRIMNLVVPQGFFGSHKNRNIVVEMITCMLEVPRFQVVKLKPYLFKLEISKIPWLNVVENINERWYALTKWLLWLLNDYVSNIIRTHLFIVTANSHRKLYFKQSVWLRLTRSYLTSRIADGGISKMCYIVEQWNGLLWHWTLVPKKDTVRPVMSMQIYTSKEALENQRRAQIYLQQLSVMNYGTKTLGEFHKTWKKVVDKFQDQSKKMYIVSCDIEDAYGAINQEKLLEIVEGLAKDIGSELQLKHFKVSKQAGPMERYESSAKWFYVNSKLQLPLAENTLIKEMPAQTIRIEKEDLSEAIRKSVRQQIVSIGHQTFLLNKGIGQGALLSSDLCNIYYGHMSAEYFAEYESNGFLFRYVDDILFITEHEELANRFLQQVENGIPEYNCTFNAKKTCANFGESKHAGNVIPFLGYNIDIESLQITIKYPECVQYTMICRQPEPKKIIKTIRDRLMNFAALKLNGITLDCTINSEPVLFKNIKLGFIRQAERCLCLLRYMLEDVSRHVNVIFNLMQETNLQLCQYVGCCLKNNGLKDCEEIFLELRWIVWQSYIEVFGMAPNIFLHFREIMLRARSFKSRKPQRFVHARDC